MDDFEEPFAPDLDPLGSAALFDLVDRFETTRPGWQQDAFCLLVAGKSAEAAARAVGVSAASVRRMLHVCEADVSAF